MTLTTYLHDAADRISSITRAGVQTPYTWSDRGELLSDGVQGYEWDAAGRLIGVTGPEELDASYTYDGANNRVGATANGVETTYIVDPFNPVDAVPQVLRETTGGQTTRSLYGLDLFAQQQGATTTYLGYDALSVRLHLDEDGAIAATYRYGPYGEVAGAGPVGYGYTGEQWDQYIEMTFLRARYYQPETGRFVSRDPLGGQVAQPITWQRFLYVGNNPLGFQDPTGLCRTPGLDCLASLGRDEGASRYTSEERRSLIYQKGMSLAGQGDDSLEKFALLMEYAQSLYDWDGIGWFEYILTQLTLLACPREICDFAKDTECVIVGACDENSGKWVLSKYRQGGGPYTLPSTIYLGKGSWKDKYYDDEPNAQMRHYWFYVGLTILQGTDVAHWGNVCHESRVHIGPCGGAAGVSTQDLDLGFQGVKTGDALRWGTLRPQDLGNHIRITLGTQVGNSVANPPSYISLPLIIPTDRP